MQDGDIDYSRYTKRELDEALAGIDRERFPKNFAHLRSAYQALNTPLPGEPSYSRAATVKGEEPWRPKHDEKGRYVPNQIPGGDRLSYGIFSLLLFAFASYGLWVNDIYLPGRWTRGVHLHDVPAEIMYGAMSCACLVMVSVVVDHYDRRDNERYYRSFAEAGRLLGWTLFILSLAWSLFDRAA